VDTHSPAGRAHGLHECLDDSLNAADLAFIDRQIITMVKDKLQVMLA